MMTLLLDALVTHSLACRCRRRIRGKAEHVALWRHGDLAARPTVRRERELARFRLHLIPHRTALKNPIHATLITFGHSCPVSDLFGLAGRELLDRFEIPDRGGATSTSASG
jgi:hypothetical protein